MNPDIRNRSDIELLITRFYERIKTDPVIGHYFTEVVKVNFEKHLPIMFDFWENILFYSGNYSGNPMAVHKHLHSLHPFTKGDFDHWLNVFQDTAHELFDGPNTDLILQRAQSIALTMQLKILHPHSFS